MSARRRRRGGIPGKKLLVVAAVLIVLVIGAVGARHFLRRDPGADLDQRNRAAHAALTAKEYDKARLLYAKLVEDVPGRVDLRLFLVTCQMELGQLDEAELQCREALKLSPNHGRAHVCLAFLAEARGERDQGILHAQAAVAGEPYAKGAQYLLSDLLLRAGRTSEGIDALTRAVEMDEGGEAAEFKLATLLTGEDPDNPAAVRARQTLLRLFEDARKELEAKPDDDAANHRFAQFAMIADRPDDAVSALVRLSTRRELTDREQMLLGRAYAAAGSVARARELIAEAESNGGAGTEEPLTVGERASSWLQVAKPQLALEILEPALEKDPKDLRLLHLKLRALWMLKVRAAPGGSVDLDLSERIDGVASSVLDIRPTDERALKYRGVVRLALGQIDGALADAAELKRTAPNSPAGYWLDGLTLLSGGNPAAALPLLIRGRDSATSPEAGSRWIARAAIWAGDAEIAAIEARSLGSMSDAAIRAGAMAVSGDLDGAEAMTVDPDFRESPLDDRGRLALVLASMGRPDYAGVVAARTRPDPGDAASFLRLSELHRAAGQEDAAEKALASAAQGRGPGRIRALMKLAEGAFKMGSVNRSVLDPIQRALRDSPAGAPFAGLLEGLAALKANDPDLALAIAREAERSRLAQPGARVLALSALLQKGVRGQEILDAAIRVLEVSPNHAQARQIRAQGLMLDVRKSLGSGELAEAEEQISELLELTPGVRGAQMLRGMLRSRLGEDSRAEEDARKMLATPGNEAAGHMLMGILAQRRGALPGAIREFEACLEAAPKATAAMASLAVCLIQVDRAEEALVLADRLEELEPTGVRSLTIRAGALATLERLPEALDMLRSFITRQPKNIGARIMLGRMLLGLGQAGEAVKEFEAAVKVAPTSFLTRSNLVTACLAAGKKATAMAHAQAIVGLEGFAVPGLIIRSRVKRAMENPSGELADLYAAVQREPANSLAHEALGAGLVSRGNLTEGRRELEKAFELSPRNVGIRMHLANLAEIEGRVSEAVSIYEQVLAQHPGHVIAANNLAYRLAADPGTAARAAELAGMAALGAPLSGDIQDTLAIALSAAGRHDEAIAAAERAMKLMPGVARIAVTAARVYRDARQIQKAVRAAGKALQLATEEEREGIQSQIKDLHLPSIGR